jgi:hypothetical protein
MIKYSWMQNAGRLTGVDYLGGKHIGYSYNSQNSIDDLLNRINTITVGSLIVSSYDYSKNNRLMEVILPEPDSSLTYQNGGLDRYGRIVNHSWIEDSLPLVHIIHGYDYSENRTYRYDAVHAASSEFYSYDAVNQVKSLQRGVSDQNNPDKKCRGFHIYLQWNQTNKINNTETTSPSFQMFYFNLLPTEINKEEIQNELIKISANVPKI